MGVHRTTRDLPLNLWGSDIILPEGTRVLQLKGASGTEGDLFAVADIAELIRLTGNSHDPKYRYAFVPSDAVSEGI